MIDDCQMTTVSDDDDDEGPSSPESAYNESDLMHVAMDDEVTAQLAAAGPVGVAAAAAIASAKKRKRPHSFETNPSIRKRQQNRLLRKLRVSFFFKFYTPTCPTLITYFNQIYFQSIIFTNKNHYFSQNYSKPYTNSQPVSVNKPSYWWPPLANQTPATKYSVPNRWKTLFAISKALSWRNLNRHWPSKHHHRFKKTHRCSNCRR